MFPISGNVIVTSIPLALVSAPLATLYSAASDLKSSADAAVVSIDMRRL